MAEPLIPVEWVPTLTRRYAATVVDGLLVLAVFILPTALWPTDDSVLRLTRVALAVAAVLVYEPLCTGRYVTLGQRVAGVRVLRFDTGARIGVARAYGRILVKGVLGFISFLTMPFTPGRRALHDMATGSIVVMADSVQDFVAWAATRPAEPVA